MKISKTKLISNTVLVTLLMSSDFALAQAPQQINTQQQSVTSLTEKTSKTEKAFKLDLGIEYSQKVVVDEKGERESGTDLMFAPSFKLNKNFGLSAKAVLTKENSGARQTSLSNTDLKLSMKGFQINEKLKTAHALSVTAPTNDEAQKVDRLRTSIAISNGVTYQSDLFKLAYGLRLSKNFHEFTVNAEGSPNIEYRLSNLLDLTVFLTDRISFTAAGNYRFGQTYGGFQRQAFTIDADLNYDLLEQLSINLGTSNEGSTVKANGVDSNLSAYNENTSVFRLGLSLSL